MDHAQLPDLESEDTLRRIAAGEWEWSTPPWKRRQGADATYRRICAEICGDLRVESKIEREDYGSGYASYVDAWFYKDDPAFLPSQHTGDGHAYVGLTVLLSRVTPYFVVGEGWKSWNEEKGSGAWSLPDWDFVDRIESKAVLDLSAKVTDLLTSQKLVRLRRAVTSRLAPADIEIATNLNSRPYRVFDVLFHWMD